MYDLCYVSGRCLLYGCAAVDYTSFLWSSGNLSMGVPECFGGYLIRSCLLSGLRDSMLAMGLVIDIIKGNSTFAFSIYINKGAKIQIPVPPPPPLLPM